MTMQDILFEEGVDGGQVRPSHNHTPQTANRKPQTLHRSPRVHPSRALQILQSSKEQLSDVLSEIPPRARHPILTTLDALKPSRRITDHQLRIAQERRHRVARARELNGGVAPPAVARHCGWLTAAPVYPPPSPPDPDRGTAELPEEKEMSTVMYDGTFGALVDVEPDPLRCESADNLLIMRESMRINANNCESMRINAIKTAQIHCWASVLRWRWTGCECG